VFKIFIFKLTWSPYEFGIEVVLQLTYEGVVCFMFGN